MVIDASFDRTGAVVSSIVNEEEVAEEFPQSSVAVKVTVAEPVAPQSSERSEKSLLQVISPQLSVADAPPFTSNHA